MRRIPTRTLNSMILCFAVVAAVLPVAGIVPGFMAVSSSAVQDRAEETLKSASRQIGQRLSAGVAEQWAVVRAVAGWAATEGVGGNFPVRIDTAKALSDRLTWMGVASPEGRVLVATGRILEGDDVAARPWFRAGLQGDFAGDLHEALLLQRHLPPRAGGEPLRLIDFAMPVRRADGSLLGVLGTHVDWDWVRDRVRNAPLPGGMDALLIARDGTVIVGPRDLEGRRLTMRSVLAGGQGVQVVSEEEWPDGERYLTAGVPAGSSTGLPGFGWTVVVRQHPEAALSGVRTLARSIGLPVLGCSILLLLLGFWLARWLGRPFMRLADSATALAEGRLQGPVPDARTTREAALLSAALARLDRPPTQASARGQA